VKASLHLLSLIVAGAGLLTETARAQLVPIPVDQLDSLGHRTSPAALGTPEEVLVDVELAGVLGRDAIAPRDSVYPRNALRERDIARARVWLDSLGPRSASGLHLDAYGRLAVEGGQVALAQREIAARIATPGLSVADQAYALYVGASAFTDGEHPEWLPIAERYLARLTALGRPVAGWQSRVRGGLALTYYQLDRGLEAVAQALKAYALLSEVPFEDREPLATDLRLYLATADVMLKMPDGASRLHAVDSLLLSVAQPSPERIALDSAVLWTGQFIANSVRAHSAFAATIGKPAPPLTSNFWINGKDTTGESRALAPGVVHLIYFFQPEIESVLPTLFGLQRVQARLGADVDVIGVASLSGHWGMTFVDPPAEAERWRQFFTRELVVPFPIGLWVKDKVPTPWQGLLPPRNPTFATYHLPAPIALLVVDGQGRVRRLFFMSREDEDDIVRYVSGLRTDRSRATTTPSGR
jgi:hypothetical protein